jgi:hypothetical protein
MKTSDENNLSRQDMTEDDLTIVEGSQITSAGDHPMPSSIENESVVYGASPPSNATDWTQEDAARANDLLVDDVAVSPSPVDAPGKPEHDAGSPVGDQEKPAPKTRAKKAKASPQDTPESAPTVDKPKRTKATKAKEVPAEAPKPTEQDAAVTSPAPSSASQANDVAALDRHAQQRLERVAANRAAELADAKKQLDADAGMRAKIHQLRDPIGRHIVAIEHAGITKAYAVEENPGIAARTVNKLREGLREGAHKLSDLVGEIGYLPDVIKTRFRSRKSGEETTYNVDPEGIDPRHPLMRHAGLGENDRRNLVVIPNGNPDEIAKHVLSSTNLPDDVKKRFVHSDTVPGQYFDRNRKLAFVDKGGRLATDQNAPEIINSMVSVAQAKGWKAITIKGHDDFKRDAWLAASLAGIEVKGYKPEAPDLARLDHERQLRLGNAIQPTTATPAPVPVANEIAGTSPGTPRQISAEAVALGEVARQKGVREDQISKFVSAAQTFIDTAKKSGIELPALKIFDPAAPAAPTITTPDMTKEKVPGIEIQHPDKAPKR